MLGMKDPVSGLMIELAAGGGDAAGYVMKFPQVPADTPATVVASGSIAAGSYVRYTVPEDGYYTVITTSGTVQNLFTQPGYSGMSDHASQWPAIYGGQAWAGVGFFLKGSMFSFAPIGSGTIGYNITRTPIEWKPSHAEMSAIGMDALNSIPAYGAYVGRASAETILGLAVNASKTIWTNNTDNWQKVIGSVLQAVATVQHSGTLTSLFEDGTIMNRQQQNPLFVQNTNSTKMVAFTFQEMLIPPKGTLVFTNGSEGAITNTGTYIQIFGWNVYTVNWKNK